MQLRDDHTLGAVDDERAFVGHQGHFAHVDLLLFDLFDHLVLRGRRFTVVDDELYLGTHGRSKRQAPGLALAHIERRLGQVVFDELHFNEAVVRNNRESRGEGSLQAVFGTLLRGGVGLQEGGIGITLHLQQVRHFEHAVTAAETLANSLAFGVAVRGCLGHEISGQRHGMGSSTNCPLKKRLGLGGWPLPTIGGRRCIAHRPNQGVFRCRMVQKTLANGLRKGCLLVHSASATHKHQRLEAF